MLRRLVLGFLIASLVIGHSLANDNDFAHCHCEDEGSWNAHIIESQRVSDFLIAIAYFSIPLELLYFLSCSNVPFKWVVVQFIAFIVLCGLTHLINGWGYYGNQTFQLMMALTVAKLLTALVSCATAITLLTLIPLLLKFKVRELFLKQNVLELDQEVGIMKKQKEASWHVRMLTQEIRKSLDRHTILYTTLVELSNTLVLQNCAVWMLNEKKTEMNLTHELRPNLSAYHPSIPKNDPDVLAITQKKGVMILRSDSVLAVQSRGGLAESGPVAAIRMPMLHVSNFKGGTPELVDTCYAILVLVLPNDSERDWSFDEMQIVEVVADQVAVALSHAAVLEESQSMREQLVEQNRVLQQAKENAMMASQARNSFQKVMSHGMRRPMHSIMGLLSILQDEKTNQNQSNIVDTIAKTSSILSTLINDVMEISAKDTGRLPLEIRPFQLHSMVKEACCLVKCLCIYQGFGFTMEVPNSIPNMVTGDEMRTFQVLLHMVGHLLNISEQGRPVIFRVSLENGNEGRNDKVWGTGRSGSVDEFVNVKFDIRTGDSGSRSELAVSSMHSGFKRQNASEVKDSLSFSMCKKIVQMMQGKIWMSSNSQGYIQSASLVLRFHIQQTFTRPLFDLGNFVDQPNSNSIFKGIQVILADDDGVNRMVTKKLLVKLGCHVTTVSSGFECLSSLGPTMTPFHLVILDLHMPEMDGFEVATRIRKFRSRNRPLIIALTASAEEQVWERCLQVGMNGVIRKPVLLRGLEKELRTVLQRAGERLSS
ncbi:protein EIN4-like [Cynara cardunculus var. scolymus]|uniref:Ethylene receptor n=1 Tax=Cynara cardunculus var. scolymus TaxID=59895 RepID=A0A103YE53_CYNCS|nr:protein EIN4-like [Cynara cardunculus var. scolymus]XP_024968893.1 protein EIN4-like [Cynara cardunculus var. scolymus]KVI07439.1 CheY-like superfamily [Cynara cardunculus var. scolymus]